MSRRKEPDETEEEFEERVAEDMAREDAKEAKYEDDDFYPENETDIQGKILKNSSKTYYPHLLEDISLANLKGTDKLYVQEAMEIFKQLGSMQPETLTIDQETGKVLLKKDCFRDDLLHDIFARCNISGSINMKKAEMFFTRTKKHSYELSQQKKKNSVLGIEV